MTFFCIIDKAGKQKICKLNFYTSNMKRNTYYPDGCNCRKANGDVWNMIMIMIWNMIMIKDLWNLK